MVVQRVRNILTRLIPEPLQIRPVWQTLDSGIKVCIDSKLSLDCFTELFITQPYAPALNILPKYEFIVDLGANRGFFVLFAVHHLLEKQVEKPRFYCIEASDANYKRLMRHFVVNSLTDRVASAQGAACGKRFGFIDFYYSPRAHGMGTIVSKRKFTSRKVPVIDVAKLITSERIDLLKLDIEGAEESFLAEYPEILAKTQVLVGEFHLKEIDHTLCQEALKKSGLSFHSRTFQFEDKLCVDIYTRTQV